MRILIYGINYSPELTGIGKYTGEMAEWLAFKGHEVRVVTAPPYYPQWKVADRFVNGWSKEQQPSLVIYRCPLWVPAKPSGLKRLLHLASFALSSFPVMLLQFFWRPDVVWVVEPPLFCAPQAWLLARLSGGKAWLHVQDYEVDAAFDLGLLKGAFIRGVVLTGEQWLMRRFDRVSTISQRMVDRAISKGVLKERVILFRNWVEIKSGSEQLSLSSGYRTELGISTDAVVALYSGNMGGKQGLEILAQAARLSGGSDGVVFVFCGNGAGRDDLVRQCEGLHNVHFLDLQPVERLSELLLMADIHLLPQRADAADLVMPSKLTGMLASGRPVVATAHEGTELAEVVHKCGLVVPPEDASSFTAAIHKLASDPEARKLMGLSGRVYAEAHLEKQAVLADFNLNLLRLTGKS